MTTFYVNIDNAYVASGDGSLGNPFNYSQFKSQFNSSNSNDIFLLSGVRSLSNGTTEQLINSNAVTLTIDAIDITQPWRIENTNGVLSIASTSGTINLKNAILKSNTNLQLFHCNTYSVYSICTANVSSESFSLAGNFRGTTFLANGYVRFTVSSTAVDSLFKTTASNMFAIAGSTINLDNCVLSMVNSSNLVGETGGYTPAGIFTINNIQFNWVPALPLSSSVNLGSLDEQDYAIDSGSGDITISASGVFTGYEKGIFGGPDRTVSHGIGAFTFPLAGVAPSIDTQPVDVTLNAGDTLELSVVASGTEPLEYQWYKNDVEIVDATGDTLVITNVHEVDTGTYKVTVTNDFGFIDSDEVTVDVVSTTSVPAIVDGESVTVVNLAQSNGQGTWTIFIDSLSRLIVKLKK